MVASRPRRRLRVRGKTLSLPDPDRARDHRRAWVGLEVFGLVKRRLGSEFDGAPNCEGEPEERRGLAPPEVGAPPIEARRDVAVADGADARRVGQRAMENLDGCAAKRRRAQAVISADFRQHLSQIGWGSPSPDEPAKCMLSFDKSGCFASGDGSGPCGEIWVNCWRKSTLHPHDHSANCKPFRTLKDF